MLWSHVVLFKYVHRKLFKMGLNLLLNEKRENVTDTERDSMSNIKSSVTY